MKIFEKWLTEPEQEMFIINEEWSSDVTKALGKQFVSYYLSKFLNSRDIDIAKSDYEVIKAPFTTKKFRQYEYAIVKWQNPHMMTTPEVCVYHFEKNGNLLVYDVSRNVAVSSMPIYKGFIHAAVGIKNVVRNTELKQKRKDDYEDTRAAKEKDPINANRVKRIMRSFKE